jgi:integrase
MGVKVRVESNSGSLRLRYTFPKGQRQTIYLGLDDSPVNRKIAGVKAHQIELDIIQGSYDLTLERYQGPKSTPIASSPTLIDLYEKFIEIKKIELESAGIQKYTATLARLRQFFPVPVRAESVTFENAVDYRDWLRLQTNNRNQPLSAVTVKERLQCTGACWQWAQEEGLIQGSGNPWRKAARSVKKQKSRPKPLNSEEIRIVLAGYRESPEYSFYSDMVQFLLGTGARFGEVSALLWGDISEDCSRVLFDKSFSRGATSPTTKNDKTGWVRLPASLTNLLKRRRLSNPTEDSLVFPSRRSGESINDRVFRKSWVSIIRQVGIEYRKPYSTRSTLISHWLSAGEDIAVVAELTRTSIKMILEHYGASIKSGSVLPELVDFEE